MAWGRRGVSHLPGDQGHPLTWRRCTFWDTQLRPESRFRFDSPDGENLDEPAQGSADWVMTNRHFGRISEVWKHLVLAEALASERPATFLDTHAGDALYPLVDDPERRFGVLTFNEIVDRHGALRESAYASVLSPLRRGPTLSGIPGGPLVAMGVLGTEAN